MSAAIIPFESATLPAYLRVANATEVNNDLTGHVGAGFPVISIKGKVFTIVRDGTRSVLPNPKDPDSPASSIDVVIIKANKNTSKIYYVDKFVEGSDAKPDCYSTDGIAPAMDSQKPQAKACATCAHNQWGARISDAGKKGKACQDNARIAVSTPGQLNEPYLMRVPPASLRPMAEYGAMLAKRGVRYNAVVTKISFDPEQATPKLVFKPVGFLDEAGAKQVLEVAASDTVEAIIGTMVFESAPAEEVAAPAAAATKEAKVTEAEVVQAVKAVAPVAAAVVPTAESFAEVDLGDLKFDD